MNNSSLNFVETEMKTEGLLNNYTDLKNPSFAKIAQAIGFQGYEVTNSSDLEQTMKEFLAHPGPALMDVHTNRFELFMPPTVSLDNVVGMAMYTTKAVLGGRFSDAANLIKNTITTFKERL
jgi:pyruvate dehydrogenase (quinone)